MLKFYLENSSDVIKKTELKYNFLPENNAVDISKIFDKLCLNAVKNIQEARLKGETPEEVSRLLEEYRNLGVREI